MDISRLQKERISSVKNLQELREQIIRLHISISEHRNSKNECNATYSKDFIKASKEKWDNEQLCLKQIRIDNSINRALYKTEDLLKEFQKLSQQHSFLDQGLKKIKDKLPIRQKSASTSVEGLESPQDILNNKNNEEFANIKKDMTKCIKKITNIEVRLSQITDTVKSVEQNFYNKTSRKLLKNSSRAGWPEKKTSFSKELLRGLSKSNELQRIESGANNKSLSSNNNLHKYNPDRIKSSLHKNGNSEFTKSDFSLSEKVFTGSNRISEANAKTVEKVDQNVLIRDLISEIIFKNKDCSEGYKPNQLKNFESEERASSNSKNKIGNECLENQFLIQNEFPDYSSAQREIFKSEKEAKTCKKDDNLFSEYQISLQRVLSTKIKLRYNALTNEISHLENDLINSFKEN